MTLFHLWMLLVPQSYTYNLGDLQGRRIVLAKVTYVLVCKVILFTNTQSFTEGLISMHFCFSLYDHLRKHKSPQVKLTLPYWITAIT